MIFENLDVIFFFENDGGFFFWENEPWANAPSIQKDAWFLEIFMMIFFFIFFLNAWGVGECP